MFDHGKVTRDSAASLSDFKDFDAVQDVVGGFGKFQKLVVFFVIVPALLPTGFFAFNVVSPGQLLVEWPLSDFPTNSRLDCLSDLSHHWLTVPVDYRSCLTCELCLVVV